MGAAPVLTILKDGEPIRSVKIEGDALLGRSEGCVIRLEDRAISRQHAFFSRKGDQVQVEKKSEFAPLVINGTDCTRAVLKEGDVISIGPYLLKLSLEERQQAQAEENPVQQETQIVAAEVPQESSQPLEIPQQAETGSEAQALELSFESSVSQAGEDPFANISLENPSDQDGMLESSIQTGDSAENQIEIAPEIILETIQQEGEATRVVSGALPEILLFVKSGQANVESYAIQKDEVSIGRGKDCDIVLMDKKASRKNALITKKGLSFSIRDLSSSNGTYVNGEKITECELSGGDVIRIGQVELELRAEQPGYADQAKDFLALSPQEEEDSAPKELQPFQMESLQEPGVLQVASPASAAGASELAAPPAAVAHAETGSAMTGIPGLAGIPGIGAATGGKPKSLIEKFRALPKRRQYIVIFLVIAFGYFFFLDDGPEQPKKPRPKTAQVQKAKAENPTATKAFSLLTKEQQAFVRTQHQLAFDYYKNKEYDKALFEIQRIFKYVDDYEDSREIERYAKDGKRKLEALAEERAKQEAEALARQKVAVLVTEARQRMSRKDYAHIGEIFSQILALDPENSQVSQWQALIQQYEEDQRAESQRQQVQLEINRRAWAVYQDGVTLKKQGKFRDAILTFERAKEIAATDHKVNVASNGQIREIRRKIAEEIDPILKEGKEAEESGDFIKAMEDYDRVLAIESESKEAHAGIARLTGVLSDRAKALYTEAILAESYSDFATAKKKFQDCLRTAPKNTTYYNRAERKLARYFKQPDEAAMGSP